jgi:hypothetical protein
MPLQMCFARRATINKTKATNTTCKNELVYVPPAMVLDNPLLNTPRVATNIPVCDEPHTDPATSVCPQMKQYLDSMARGVDSWVPQSASNTMGSLTGKLFCDSRDLQKVSDVLSRCDEAYAMDDAHKMRFVNMPVADSSRGCFSGPASELMFGSDMAAWDVLSMHAPSAVLNTAARMTLGAIGYFLAVTAPQLKAARVSAQSRTNGTEAPSAEALANLRTNAPQASEAPGPTPEQQEKAKFLAQISSPDWMKFRGSSASTDGIAMFGEEGFQQACTEFSALLTGADADQFVQKHPRQLCALHARNFVGVCSNNGEAEDASAPHWCADDLAQAFKHTISLHHLNRMSMRLTPVYVATAFACAQSLATNEKGEVKQKTVHVRQKNAGNGAYQNNSYTGSKTPNNSPVIWTTSSSTHISANTTQNSAAGAPGWQDSQVAPDEDAALELDVASIIHASYPVHNNEVVGASTTTRFGMPMAPHAGYQDFSGLEVKPDLPGGVPAERTFQVSLSCMQWVNALFQGFVADVSVQLGKQTNSVHGLDMCDDMVSVLLNETVSLALIETALNHRVMFPEISVKNLIAAIKPHAGTADQTASDGRAPAVYDPTNIQLILGMHPMAPCSRVREY